MLGFRMVDCFNLFIIEGIKIFFIEGFSFIMVIMIDGGRWFGIVVYMCVKFVFWYLINFYGDVLFFLFFWYSFCLSDSKFVICFDDGIVRIWDFMKCYEEKIFRGMLGYWWIFI